MYFEYEICAQIILQRRQRQPDEEWKNDSTRSRKIGVQFYNIWMMPSNATTDKLHYTVGIRKRGW
jgi:hypothetical protein